MWKTDETIGVRAAVKAFERRKNYCVELACYQRLREHNITRIDGFTIPQLLNWDDDLMVIAMQLVTAPYILDFGKAYLDSQPEHSPEQWADHNRQQLELWGAYLPRVQSVLRQLEYIGIYYRDPKPGNIMFEDWEVE